jgi:hypothetical protein
MLLVIIIIYFSVQTTSYFVERVNRIMSGDMQRTESQGKMRNVILELHGTKTTGATGSLTE